MFLADAFKISSIIIDGFCLGISQPQSEIRDLAEYFCYGNTIPPLIKLDRTIQISVLIQTQERADKDERCSTLLKLSLALELLEGSSLYKKI